MNIRHTIAAVIVSLGLSGCTEHSLPQFDNPMPVTVPSGKPAYGPRITQNDSDNAILSWMERRDDQKSLHYSRLVEDAWLPPKLVVQDAAMLKFILIVAAGYIVIVVLMYFMQGRMVYLGEVPGRTLTMTPSVVSMETS